MGNSFDRTCTRCRSRPNPIPRWSADIRDQVEEGQSIEFLGFQGQCSILGERDDVWIRRGGRRGTGVDIDTGTGHPQQYTMPLTSLPSRWWYQIRGVKSQRDSRPEWRWYEGGENGLKVKWVWIKFFLDWVVQRSCIWVGTNKRRQVMPDLTKFSLMEHYSYTNTDTWHAIVQSSISSSSIGGGQSWNDMLVSSLRK